MADTTAGVVDPARLARRLEREYRARMEAEAIAERATRELYVTVGELKGSRAALDETIDLVAITDVEGHPSYLNRAFCEFLGIETGDFGEVNVFDLLTPASRARVVEEGVGTLRDKGVWRGEVALMLPGGGEVPVSQVLVAHRRPNGEIDNISSIARDMSEQRALEERLTQQAFHDPLTGLANRRLLFDHLDLALARADRSAHPTAVLFLDLDRFKEINDTQGHGQGDEVLVAVADRLRAAVRPADIDARFGGDEFVILCEGLSGEGDAVALAGRVAEILGAPLAVDGAELRLTVSIGIALSTSVDPGDPEALLRNADRALYRAKEAGRDQYQVARPDDA